MRALVLQFTTRSWLGMLLIVGLFPQSAWGQLVVKSRKQWSGTIRSVSGSTIRAEIDGKDRTLHYTMPGKETVPLPLAGTNLRHRTAIVVKGQVPADSLQPGQRVELHLEMTRSGRSRGDIENLKLFGGGDEGADAIQPEKEPGNAREFVRCLVRASVKSVQRNVLQLSISRQPFAPQGRIRCRLADNAGVAINEQGLDRVKPGDRIAQTIVLELDSGDLVVESMTVELAERDNAGERNRSGTVDRFAEANYLKYSDRPSNPRDVRSARFLLHTDLSDRSARKLLDKLEYMLELMARYFQRSPAGIIECYVVRDLSQWNDIPLEAAGVAKIREGAGVTISRSLGKQRKAIVYSCAKHGVVQHEAVHAFCFQTFGSTGPTWYSEGMAEMGQYWKKDNLAVDVSPEVVSYLRGTQPPKKLLEIVAQGQITGDSWQAYAWRWALCHLLANNPNYSGRFKGLGLNMMTGGSATFESVYGDVALEISFEYDQFIRNLGNGYRVDLCQWDWSTRPRPIAGNRRVQSRIVANRGWQSSRLKVQKGKRYEYVCTGEWSSQKTGDLHDGDGNGQGHGKLVGVIFHDYTLSKEMVLGQRGVLEAPLDGHLFLRCQDSFSDLSDNRGEITVHFRPAAAKE